MNDLFSELVLLLEQRYSRVSTNSVVPALYPHDSSMNWFFKKRADRHQSIFAKLPADFQEVLEDGQTPFSVFAISPGQTITVILLCIFLFMICLGYIALTFLFPRMPVLDNPEMRLYSIIAIIILPIFAAGFWLMRRTFVVLVPIGIARFYLLKTQVTRWDEIVYVTLHGNAWKPSILLKR
jgi:hypothetical protein